MNQYEMVILVVLIVVVGRVLRNRYRSHQDDDRAARPEPGAVDAREAERMRAEITRLNERLAVLERIATDPAKRLSDEIDSLKHK